MENREEKGKRQIGEKKGMAKKRKIHEIALIDAEIKRYTLSLVFEREQSGQTLVKVGMAETLIIDGVVKCNSSLKITSISQFTCVKRM